MSIANPGLDTLTASSIPEFYARQDALTDPGVLSRLYDDLPDDPSALREIVANLIAHVSWAARYGISPDVLMPRSTQSVTDRLKLIQTGVTQDGNDVTAM